MTADMLTHHQIQGQAHARGAFKVLSRRTGRELVGAFVLLPEVDGAARIALDAYAKATSNEKVRCLIIKWLNRLNNKRQGEGVGDGVDEHREHQRAYAVCRRGKFTGPPRGPGARGSGRPNQTNE